LGEKYLFQAKTKSFVLGQRTWLMGVVNVTPDSFYDGGTYYEPARAVERGLELAAEGAEIIDIGGESTRPGSDPVPAEEEQRRVLPVIKAIRKRIKALISVDTTKAEVAEAALAAGADIINDISAGRFDSRMLPLAARSGAGLILMHMKGTPRTMQVSPHYDDVLAEVRAFLEERIEAAESFGIRRERIVIDPGIGFGKNLADNLTLLNNLSALAELGRPVLVGISRKSFIGNILNLEAHERLEGTIAAAVVSILRGASLLRVHDLQAVKRAITVAETILSQEKRKGPGEGRRKTYVH
jgi:dihydropteroate synthase